MPCRRQALLRVLDDRLVERRERNTFRKRGRERVTKLEYPGKFVAAHGLLLYSDRSNMIFIWWSIPIRRGEARACFLLQRFRIQLAGVTAVDPSC
jgi:hypothetical protein